MGHGRRRRDRCCAVPDARRCCEVRTAMSTDQGAVPADGMVIAARDLTKRYGKACAVDKISFGIARGEVFGLLGPNGAGKTTTILMMLGLTDISSGTVRVLGF